MLGKMSPWYLTQALPGAGLVESECGKLLGDHCGPVILVKLEPEPAEWQPEPP